MNARLRNLEKKVDDCELLKTDLTSAVTRVETLETNHRAVINNIVKVEEAIDTMAATDMDIQGKTTQLAAHVMKVEKLVTGINTLVSHNNFTKTST